MENEWPPLETCPQYIYDILRPFLQKFDWEDDQADETQYEYTYSDDEDEDAVPLKFAFKPSSLKKFVQLVRTTRGYNVNVGTPLPNFMCSPFIRVVKEDKSLGLYEEWVNIAIELAIEHINSKTKKFYKHLNTLNVVDTRHRILLITFTAGAVAAKFTKRMKENPEEWQQKVAATALEPEQTFLAAVSAPAPARETFKLLECFLKPQGPAPWEYEELPKC